MTESRRLGRELLVVLVAAAVGVGGTAAYAVAQIVRQGNTDEARPADAIVVLGAAQYNGTPSPVFESRLAHAVDLYKQGLAPFLIVTGGKLPGDRTTEAATARAYAIAHGVPRSAILGENQGRNTLESIVSVAAILRAHDLSSAVFVSDRTHMLRVLRMATDQGLVAWGSPTPNGPIDEDPALRSRQIVHELAGLAAYLVGGGVLGGDTAVGANP
jgi:uncharacterized SAM-binding protein YcdF (DUF218 family)